MQESGVALLAPLHPGVPTHVGVPLLEAVRRLQPEALDDGAFAAVGEQLDTAEEFFTIQWELKQQELICLF